MAIEKKYINFDEVAETTMSTKLYVDQYNSNELIKAVDTKVTELIKALPEANLDLVPRPVYNQELSHSLDLERTINILQADNDGLRGRIQSLMADSSSLYIDNDGLRVAAARLENTVASVQKTTLELRTNLTTSLTKAINEATERTTLEAENSGLTAQKNALIKQIDTLNNLLAQANATLQAAQQQLSAKQQAIAAGGVSTGELATILWEKGDPSKNPEAKGFAYDIDLSEGGKKVKGPAGYAKAWSSGYVDVIAGPKDIKVDIKQTFFLVPSTFTLKANSQDRFKFDKPNIYAVPSPKNKGLKNAAYAASAIAATTGAYIAVSAVASAAAGAALVAGAGAVAAGGLGAFAAIGAALGPVGWAVLGAVAIGTAIFGLTQKNYTDYEETITITVTDIDKGGKVESKTFQGKVHSYN
jgi:regulator of replication initiation timing